MRACTYYACMHVEATRPTYGHLTDCMDALVVVITVTTLHFDSCWHR